MSVLNAISSMSDEEKTAIKEAVAYNKVKVKNGKYDAGALNFMFKEWAKLFPKVKQSMKCKGCRNSVVKFFEKVVDIIEKEEKENSKTLTGALSPTGPRA